MPSCYLCGQPATKPLELKSSFTAHSSARVPTSDKMCDRCHKTIIGEWQLCWYWNEGKGKWSKLWSRNWSWLWQGDTLLAPTIESSRTEGKDTLSIVSNLPTRQNIRLWLLNPPEPPFTIAIAESGQKHVLPWAIAAQNRDYFPVQMELDCVYVERAEFTELLYCYEQLMAMDFSKSEIDSGDYRSDRLAKVVGDEGFWELDESAKKYRGGLQLKLASFVAQAKI